MREGFNEQYCDSFLALTAMHNCYRFVNGWAITIPTSQLPNPYHLL
jgi:hypothetical protein